VTLMGLGVASIVLSLFALDQLGSDERKMAIGGIIGGALVIVGWSVHLVGKRYDEPPPEILSLNPRRLRGLERRNEGPKSLLWIHAG